MHTTIYVQTIFEKCISSYMKKHPISLQEKIVINITNQKHDVSKTRCVRYELHTFLHDCVETEV